MPDLLGDPKGGPHYGPKYQQVSRFHDFFSENLADISTSTLENPGSATDFKSNLSLLFFLLAKVCVTETISYLFSELFWSTVQILPSKYVHAEHGKSELLPPC